MQPAEAGHVTALPQEDDLVRTLLPEEELFWT